MNNVPAALERAMSATLRQFADLGGGVALRAFQSLIDDPTVDEDGSKYWPCVDIRASAPATDENQITLYSDIAMLCGTYNEDDRQHTVLRGLYEAVQGLCDRVFDEFHGEYYGEDGQDESATTLAQTAFEASVNSELTRAINIGGYTFQAGMAPYDDGGINMIGITLRVHYTRIT